ncbi:MAG: MmgE/PrpD family protein [Rhodospirillales bacterium]|nr:MmgE/PrpD family protein [Rhodospirillales bacterium]
MPENAKLAILDCVAVSLLAASNEIGRNLVRFAQENCSPGSCTVWGLGLRTTPRDAALINATLAHGLDYDDRGHASTFTLAVADPLFATRVQGIGPGARGWHANGIIGGIAAACSAAKLFKLNTDDTLTAIGLAAGACGGLTRDGGTMAKPFRAGQAAMTGLTSVMLARSGFTSDTKSLEGHRGLLDAIGPLDQAVVASLCENLGTKYDLERDVGVKTFASCTATHGAVEAVLRLVAGQQIVPADVVAIECDLRSSTLLRIRPTRGFEGRFSMPFCLAVALCERSLKSHHFTDDMVDRPDIDRLMASVRHVPKSETVDIVLAGGARLSEPIRALKDLTTRAEIEAKFADCVGASISEDRRKLLCEQIANFDRLQSIGALMDTLNVSVQ